MRGIIKTGVYICLMAISIMAKAGGGTTYYSIANGSFTSTSVWSTALCAGASCSCTPTTASTIQICAGTSIVYTGSYDLTGSLDIYGTLEITDTLNIGGKLTIETGGKLIVDGDVTNSQNGNGANAPVDNGTFIVKGNVDDGGASQFLKGSGTLTVTGTIYGSGSVFGISPVSCHNCSVSTGGTTLLPVTLLYFTANNSSNGVNLLWVTASEASNKYFSIERSTDGVSFTLLGSLSGAGTTSTEHSYSFIDAMPENGTNYYRLSQTDFDGHVTNVGMSDINIEGRTGIIKVIPNPVQNNCSVSFYNNINENSVLSVYDYTGREVFAMHIAIAIGANTPSLDLSLLAPGMYFISLPLASGQLKAKLIRQ